MFFLAHILLASMRMFMILKECDFTDDFKLMLNGGPPYYQNNEDNKYVVALKV